MTDVPDIRKAAGRRRRHHPVRRAVIVSVVTTVALVVPTTVWAATTFNDVPPGHTFATDIAWMANTGVAKGYNDGGYHPNDPVTRQAMAAFIHRAYDLENGTDVFGSRSLAAGTAVTSETYTNLASASGDLTPITLTVPEGTTASIEVTVSGNTQCFEADGASSDYCKIRATVNDETINEVTPRVPGGNATRQPFSFTIAPVGYSPPGTKQIRIQTAVTNLDGENDTSITLSNVTVTAQLHLR